MHEKQSTVGKCCFIYPESLNLLTVTKPINRLTHRTNSGLRIYFKKFDKCLTLIFNYLHLPCECENYALTLSPSFCLGTGTNENLNHS